MKIITAEKLQEILREHSEWLSSNEAKGHRANLSRANLSRANLSWANLSGADLSWVNLSGADLSWANLSGTDLSRANLSGADLSGADLSGADLSETNLSGADLSEADLSGANLDYSAIPLRCASLSIKCDTRLAAQLAYHLLRLDCDDARSLLKSQELRELAGKFHRFAECGGLPDAEENKQ